MTRVDIMSELGQDYLMDSYPDPRKPKRERDRTIKIDDKIFQQAVQEGIIEKTADGYVFVGKYDDIKKMNKKH